MGECLQKLRQAGKAYEEKFGDLPEINNKIEALIRLVANP